MTEILNNLDMINHPISQYNRAFHTATITNLPALLTQCEKEFQEGRVRYHFLILREKDAGFLINTAESLVIKKSLLTPVVLPRSCDNITSSDMSAKVMDLNNDISLFRLLDKALRDKFNCVDIKEIYHQRHDAQARAEQQAHDDKAHLAAKAALKPAFKFKLR